jgi:hypothetical protein
MRRQWAAVEFRACDARDSRIDIIRSRFAVDRFPVK